MGNQPCGGDCLPDPDASMRLSYPGTDNVLVDLNRASDEKRYKIVYSGEPATKEFKDHTPRKTLNFDEDADRVGLERPFDISFSQSCIHPAQVQESFTMIDPIHSRIIPLQPAGQQYNTNQRQNWQHTPNQGNFPKGLLDNRFQPGQHHWGTAFQDKENRWHH